MGIKACFELLMGEPRLTVRNESYRELRQRGVVPEIAAEVADAFYASSDIRDDNYPGFTDTEDGQWARNWTKGQLIARGAISNSDIKPDN